MAYFILTAQNRDKWKVLANPANENSVVYDFHTYSFEKINSKEHLSQKLHF